MGKLRSYLSQVQDFIANPISRNVMLNDLYQEALELLFNDNKEPPKEAVVLKVFPQNQTTGELKEGEEQFQSAVIRIPGLHDSVPDPVRLMKNSTNGELNSCIQIHGVCFSKNALASSESSTSPPEMVKVGDVVRVEYINGVPRFGEVIKKDKEYAKLQFISEIPEDQDLNVNEKELQKKFKENEITSLQDLSGSPSLEENVVYKNAIEELENNIPITQEVVEYPSNLQFLTNRVTEEYKIWKNKKEKDSSVYETLKKYWDNIGWNEAGGNDPTWTPAGVPWSAAYISWIVGDKFFPKGASHYKYSNDALNNRKSKTGKWWLFSLKREKIKINIGDIFVKTRSDGSKKTYYASHGDIVWKIEKGVAYLTGGNVGNTMKTQIKIALNEDGTPKSTGKYIILVKRVE